jgi:helix-turn-helix protein
MSRLRGNLPTYLQRRFGISRRTFERWCTRGDVPGAYRTRGGHWRVRKASMAMFKSFIMRPRGKTRRDKVGSEIVNYPIGGTLGPRFFEELEERTAAIKLTLATYGITDEDFTDDKLSERDPGKSYILWEMSPPPLHPRALEAVNDPQHALPLAAYMIRLNGRKVTRASLARALKVSIATLYRKYGRLALRTACQEPPGSVS